jgi:hypothetical protein
MKLLDPDQDPYVRLPAGTSIRRGLEDAREHRAGKGAIQALEHLGT